MWMPWEPEAYKTGRVEYLEEELNQLMNEKNKNEADAKQQFEKRVLEAKRNAINENKKIAKGTGNKLTQNIDKNGNLVGVNNTIEIHFQIRKKSVRLIFVKSYLKEIILNVEVLLKMQLIEV